METRLYDSLLIERERERESNIKKLYLEIFMGNGELKKTEGSFQGSMKFDCLEVGVAKGMLKRRFVAHRRVVFVGNAFTPSNVALRGPRYSEEFVIKCQ